MHVLFFTHLQKTLRTCSQTSVIKLICRLITVGETLPNTNSQASRRTHTAALVLSLISSHGRVTPLALRERLCGCSHVYVWEISNDERMPFQVWTGGASVQCPTLSPYAGTHALPLTHTLTLCMCVCGTYSDIHTQRCNFIINSCTLYSIATIWSPHLRFVKILVTLPPNPRLTLIQSSQWVQDLSRTICGSYTDTSPSSILFPLIFPSSSNPNERASLFCSVCLRSLFSLWILSSSSLSLPCSYMLGPLQCFSISSPCGVMDYNVTFIFWGFPFPCQETGPGLLVFLFIIPPRQTKQKKLWGLNLSVSLYRLWIWIRESLSLRGLHAQTICFPLVVI